jgi:hypothetical protein
MKYDVGNPGLIYREFVKCETHRLFIENLLNVKHIDYL